MGAAGQLTHVGGGDHGEGNDTTFTYDPMGRRTSMTRGNHTTTYTYDQAGALTSTSARDHTTTYAYDQAGRRVERASGPETTTYAYDAAGRLAAVTSTRGEGTARVETRTYDGEGSLVGVTHDDDDDDEGGGDTTLIWDTTTPVPEIAVVREDGVDTNLVYGARRALGLSGADVSVFAYDSSHSAIRGDDDDDDPLVRAQRYDVFGVPGDSSEAGITFGYRGEAHIGELVHLRARDYDPATGTFTTRDPLEGIPGTPTATNPYPYAANDPVNKVDPLGLSPSDATFFGLLRPLASPVRQIWWAGAGPMGSAFQRFLAELDRIERASSSNDDFVRTAARELGGFDAGRIGILPEDAPLWPWDVPEALDRGRPPNEIIGSSGWRADLIDNDGPGGPSPARHFIGWLAEGYFHPHVADDNLEIAEAAGPGQSMQDRRSGEIAIDLGILLRRGFISRREILFLIEISAGDPTNTFNGNRDNEPTGGDPLACSLPLAPC